MASIRVGRYEVTESLGEGGMGVVYRGVDPVLERPVAIKVIHPRRLTVEAKDRFLREARAMTRLDSPYIVKLYDIGSQMEGTKELHYIVMELVNGQTLSSLIEDKGLPNRKLLVQRLKIFWQLLKAMQYAHTEKVVHRDLKPDNVMIAIDGRVKVMDFGLAVMDQNNSQTRDGQIMGTMAYFAPEQAKGTKVDHRADLYALGVILFELSTGALPFLGSNAMEMIYKVISEEPPVPSKLNPGLPKGLDTMIARALRKEPAERYQHASEMIKDLEQVLVDAYQVPGQQLDPDAVPEVLDRPAPEVSLANSMIHFKMPELKVTRPPSLLATTAEIIQRATAQPPRAVDLTRIDGPPFNTPPEPRPRPPAPEPAARTPKPELPARPPSSPPKKLITATGQPAVASSGWFDEVSHNPPLVPSVSSVQHAVPADGGGHPAAQLLGSAGRRQMCSCGASVPLDAKTCPECNQPMGTSYYVVSREALDLLQRSKNALVEGEFQEALEAAQGALAKDDKQLEAYLCMGKAELALKQFEAALEHLRKAWEVLEDSTEPGLALAEAYLAQGDIEGVIGSLLGVLDRAPLDIETRCRLAFLYSETNRIPEALEHYKKVLKQNSRHVLANRQIGALLFRLNKVDEALKYLEFAHQTHPEDAQSCVLLGRIYAQRRQFNQAEQAFQSAVRLKPEDGSLRVELGAIFQVQNRDDQAIAELRNALELDGGNRAARLRLASLYERHDRFDFALRELEEAFRYHPQDITVNRRLGEIYLHKRDLMRALIYFENVVRLDPQCAEMHNKLGRLYLKQDYTAKSIDHYKQAVELHRLEPEYREDLAMAFYCAGDNLNAAKELHKAQTLDSHNADYVKALGILYHNLGDNDQSVRYLQSYLQGRPSDGQARGILGQTFSRQGLTNLAVTEYTRALELDPKLTVLHLLLAKALSAAGRHSEAIASFRSFASQLGGLDDSVFGSQAYLDMGQSYLATGQLVRASEVFQMALKRNPREAGALLGLARVAMAKRDLPGAQERLREAIALEPRNPAVLEAKADVQGREGNWSEAVVTLQKAIADNPAVPALHEFLGRALRRANRLPEAAATFRRAGEAFPKRVAQFLWLEGRIELRAENFSKAVGLFRKALEKSVGDSTITLDFVQACQALGLFDEALVAIDLALQSAGSKQAANLRRSRQLVEEDRLKKRR
jgi:serine/threonine protein kinase/tetratricopeptide (TPR) repeat protein